MFITDGLTGDRPDLDPDDVGADAGAVQLPGL